MKPKVFKINNPKAIAEINKLLEDKRHIHEKIREGKVDEIRSNIKFVKWPKN